jgi:hypothetical protein
MASDFSLSSGTTPVRDEGIWFVWVKILTKIQEAGGSAHNDPRHNDTLRTLRVKVDRALNGL